MYPQPLEEFLRPLNIDTSTVLKLSKAFHANFVDLAANSKDQFLPTPISESILRPVSKGDHGRHLAIDIGGTNLRVGFVELSRKGTQVPFNLSNGDASATTDSSAQVRRLLEKSWPIGEPLKSQNAENLFDWIGQCIADVVQDACKQWHLPPDAELPLGVTFSFPMVQQSLSAATLMSMGKGFAITAGLELGTLLQQGYQKFRGDLPPIRIVAISNDSVSTLISFIYKYDESIYKKACVGLIVGTGCNATIPLKLSCLHESKWPQNVSLLPGEALDDVRIAVNTEWSIKGSAPPLRKLGLVSVWDDELDAAGEFPGFQPLEYMTAGRYLGELARIMLVDYLEKVLGLASATFPTKIMKRFGLTTIFLSHYRPLDTSTLIPLLDREFPLATGDFQWTAEIATALYHITKAIEVRAAGIVSAAIIALLRLAEDIPDKAPDADGDVRELGVGYTGGCIVHFQNYLADTQRFLDELVKMDFGDRPPVKVVLSPCHDGGIQGAGILAAATQASQDRQK